MKTILITFLSFTILSSATAQLSKGQWIVGGIGDYSHSKGDASFNGVVEGDSKGTQYSISPGFGYFFIDRLCGGFRIGASGLTTEENYSAMGPVIFMSYFSKTKINSFRFSPFVRYYILKNSQKINLFAEAAYIHTSGKSKVHLIQSSGNGSNPPSISESVATDKINSSSYSVAAGPAFFLNPKVSLELALKYTHSKDGGQSANTFGIGAGFQIHLGK